MLTSIAVNISGLDYQKIALNHEYIRTIILNYYGDLKTKLVENQINVYQV